MKLAVIFPGVGYHCDKPLLYYSKKLLRELEYDIVEMNYENLPTKIKGDKAKMKEAFFMALDQCEEAVSHIDFLQYESIVFVGKSIGSAIATALAQKLNLNPYMILLTPVKHTFSYETEFEGIALHGTLDDWADTELIKSLCEMKKIKLSLFKDGNHSLETGNIATDLAYLHEAMRIISGVL